jgi:hypothetical protein
MDPTGFWSLNLRGTLYYPENKVEERRRGASGTLRFDLGNDGNFLFNRSGFAVFALFRPNPPYNQERSTLVRVGPQSEAAPAFSCSGTGPQTRLAPRSFQQAVGAK